MEPKADSQDFDETLRGDDFDFEFDEDFETEVRSEYVVMDAMRFDREAGTASCNFEIDDDVEDAFQIPGAKPATGQVVPQPKSNEAKTPPNDKAKK